MAQTPVVTGYKEIDRKLQAFAPKVQKKLLRQSLRKGGKRVLSRFKAIARAEAHDTGVYEKSASVKAMKRSRSRVGVSVVVDRDKYLAKYAAAYGKPPSSAGGGEPFYVPAALEFGYIARDGSHVEGIRAQRRALYENESQVKGDFVSDMREAIREA